MPEWLNLVLRSTSQNAFRPPSPGIAVIFYVDIHDINTNGFFFGISNIHRKTACMLFDFSTIGIASNSNIIVHIVVLIFRLSISYRTRISY